MRMISKISKFALCAVASLMLVGCYSFTTDGSIELTVDGHKVVANFDYTEFSRDEVQGLDGKWYDMMSATGQAILLAYANSGKKDLPLRHAEGTENIHNVTITFDDGVTKSYTVPPSITDPYGYDFRYWVEKQVKDYYKTKGTKGTTGTTGDDEDTSCEGKEGSAGCKAATDAIVKAVQDIIQNSAQSATSGGGRSGYVIP